MFKPTFCLTITSALMLATAADAEAVRKVSTSPKPVRAAAVQHPEITVDKVVQLVEARVPEPLILKQVSNRKFNLTVDQMLRLKAAGASDQLLTTMAGGAEASPTPAPTAPAQVAAPVVTNQLVASAPPAAPVQATSAVYSIPATVPALPAPAPQKKRVAVDDFDYSTVKTAVQQIFNNDQNIGRGIRAMLTHRITSGGGLTIVERAKLESLTGEQDLGVSNRVKQGTNARVGRIKGAEAILMGDIVAFGRDDRQKKFSAGGLLGKWGEIGGGFLSKWGREDKAVVVITYRLVDAETSEVITTGEARGESVRKSKGWGGLLVVPSAAGGVGMSVESSNFAQTIIGEATLDCVNKLSEILNTSAPKLPARKIEVEARVADVTGSALIISAGTTQGVQVGDRFSVERILSQVVDPVTKEILDIKTQKVGDLVITSVREKIASGTYSGVGSAQVNDAVMKQ